MLPLLPRITRDNATWAGDGQHLVQRNSDTVGSSPLHTTAGHATWANRLWCLGDKRVALYPLVSKFSAYSASRSAGIRDERDRNESCGCVAIERRFERGNVDPRLRRQLESAPALVEPEVKS